MATIDKILVFIENKHKEQPALQKARLLANQCQATLVLFSVVYDETVGHNSVLPQDIKDQMKSALLLQCDTFLEELSRSVEEENIAVTTHSMWCANPLYAINKICEETSGVKLIIKASHRHGTLTSKVLTPLDWHLIRQAPAPVLLIKSAAEWSMRRLLIAIDATSEDEQHQALNESLMHIADQYAKAFVLDSYIVNAYPVLETPLGLLYNKSAMQDMNQMLKKGHMKAVKSYANWLKIAEPKQYVQSGEPSQVIPDVAKTVQADLVVIGTVARHGLSNLLVGNTSEAIIDKVETDILIINPRV